MKKIYWILFLYVIIWILRTVVAVQIDFPTIIAILLWIWFASFTDKIVVEYIKKYNYQRNFVWNKNHTRQENKKNYTSKNLLFFQKNKVWKIKNYTRSKFRDVQLKKINPLNRDHEFEARIVSNRILSSDRCKRTRIERGWKKRSWHEKTTLSIKCCNLT